MKKIFIFVSMLLFTQIIFGQTIYINSDQIWNTDGTYDEIIITSGNTLTLDHVTLSMKDGGKITIESEAKLDILFATIEAAETQWDGIRMQNESAFKMKAGYVKNALIGLKLNGNGDVNLIGNCYFLDNDYGMKFVFPEQGECTSKIILQFGSWFHNSIKGIEFFGKAEEISISHADFSSCGTGIDIFKPWFDNIGAIPQIYRSNFLNCDAGIESIYSGVNIEQSKFEGGETAMWLEDCVSADINHNKFNDYTFAGIVSYGSSFYLHNENNFNNCETGVLALDSYSNSHFTIVEDNYFGNCVNAIDVSGVDDFTGSKIEGNIFEFNEFTIFAHGSNHFNIKGNELYRNDFNVNINNSGDDENHIFCNKIVNSWNALQIHFNNEMTDFIGNSFIDISYTDAILRGCDIAPDIGNHEFAAMNSFSENSEDITLVGSVVPFTYWIPPNATNNLDPDGIPASWKGKAFYEGVDCELPGDSLQVDATTLDRWIDDFCYYWHLYRYDINNEYYKKKYFEAKKKLGRYFTIYYSNINHVDITWNHLIKYLKKICDNFYFQRKLYGVYLKMGDCIRADSVLNAIEVSLDETPLNNRVDSLDRARKRSFVDIQRIALRYDCAIRQMSRDSSFVFETEEIDLLYEEAQKNLPEAGYARALYYEATKVLLPNDRYISMSKSIPEATLGISDNVSNGFYIYPNPVTEKIFIDYKTDIEVNADVTLYDIMGRKVFEQKFDFDNDDRLDINVSEYNSGVYLMTIGDEEGNILKTEKIIIKSQ